MLYSIVAVLVIILDQIVKYWVGNTLFGTDIVEFIPGVISLVNVHNDGAAFSFLAGGGARIYFIVITAVFTLLVIIALATNFISGRISRWSLVFITAGGLANCIDRIIYGYVVDMFKVELFNFAVFNVADAFITVFAIIFAIAMIFERQDDDEDEYEDEEDEEPEEKPRRKLFGRKKKDADDEYYEEDEPVRPARKQRKAAAETEETARMPRKTREEPEPGRRQRKPNYSQEYEQYKAQRAARERAKAPVETPPPAPSSDNPFAEWERANARVDSQRSSSLAAKAMGTSAPSYARTEPAPRRAAESVQQTPIQRSAEPVRRAPEAARPAKPAEDPVKAAASTEFNLDDILAEFK